jgi:hypothetical protein
MNGKQDTHIAVAIFAALLAIATITSNGRRTTRLTLRRFAKQSPEPICGL